MGLALVMLGGAACGSGHPAAAPVTSVAPTPSTSTPSSTVSPSPPASSSTTVAATTTSTTGPGLCATGALAASLDGSNGAAGSTGYVLALRNTGSTPCVLQGYPGVSLVAGSDGHQVGAAAVRDLGPTPRIVVDPGKAAEASLIVVDAGNLPAACRPVSALGLRVYPPGDYLALYVPAGVQTCAARQYRTLRIGPVQVGPITS